MSNINEDFQKMVADLMKSGSVMKDEWTNNEKEKIRSISELGKAAYKLHNRINKDFFPQDVDSDYEIYHMSYAFCGEVGELSDALKKSIIYRKELDNKNVIEELGDLHFYLQGIINIYNANPMRYIEINMFISNLIVKLGRITTLFDLTIEQVKEQNMIKLLKGRYKEGKYTDEQAKERADKNNDFVLITFHFGDASDKTKEELKVKFFPDIPKVCFEDSDNIIAQYVSASGALFDQELLIQMCKSKIEKEGK